MTQPLQITKRKRRNECPVDVVDHYKCRTSEQVPPSWLVLVICAALLNNTFPQVNGFVPLTDMTKINPFAVMNPPLFKSSIESLWYPNHQEYEASLSRAKMHSTSALRMVLTTPESIIEEASTQKLLDDLIDESTRVSARRPIIMQFDPTAIRIWRRWRGTVFSETWPTALKNIIYASIMTKILYSTVGAKTYLQGFNILWGQLLSVTTFTLTFFLNQSYSLWRKCYEHSRRLQGRLNDLGLTLAAHAARTNPSDPEIPSTYTQPARQALELVARYIRLFNIITYASFTLSHRPILTPRGMRRLQERGLMTAKEREVLTNAKVAATQRHNAILMWITRIFIEARLAGHLDGGAGFENQFVEKIHVIRAQYGAIGDELQARMPLAYAHIVQVLVDVILWMYPITAFVSEINPILSVLGTGLMTVFYQGLFDLAKQFLDPYDNENYGKGDDPLCVDTLVAETNSGSVRWLYGFEQQPFNAERLREGEFYDGLPMRGYSVEELIDREAQAEEARKKEQQKRLEEEEKKKKVQSLIDSGYIKTGNGTVAQPQSEVQTIVASTNLADKPSNTTLLMTKNVTTPVLDTKSKSIESSKEKSQVKLESSISEVLQVDKTQSKTPTLDAIVNGVLAGNLTRPVPTSLNVTSGIIKPPESEGIKVVNDTISYNKEYPLDVDLFAGFEWFDSVGPDGKEYRLGNMLADEVWEFDDDDDDDEHEGDLEKQDLPSPIKKKSKLPVLADQTRWDGVSQLWGAPLTVRPPSETPGLRFDDAPFENVYQLWGVASSSADQDVQRTASESVPERSYEGITQLSWAGVDVSTVTGESSTRKTAGAGSFSTGLQWHDEVSPDGQEYRLSQMLADEDWEDEVEEERGPLTVEEFKEQAIEFVKKTAEELYETEAIMNAPPAADSIREIEERKEQMEALERRQRDLRAARNETVVPAQAFLNSTALEILEMDSNEPLPKIMPKKSAIVTVPNPSEKLAVTSLGGEEVVDTEAPFTQTSFDIGVVDVDDDDKPIQPSKDNFDDQGHGNDDTSTLS